MEATIDALIALVEEVRTSGTFESDFGAHTETKFGDPGIVEIHEYPYFFVEPISDNPSTGTLGLAGWQVRELVIRIGFCVDVSDYFDASVEEVPGMRKVVQAMEILRNRLMRLSTNTLNNTLGVRRVMISGVEYKPEIRGQDAFVMCGYITLGVDKQYQNED